MDYLVMFRSPSLFAYLFLVVLCLATHVYASEPELVISQGIQLISEQRTNAETQIAILKRLLAEQEVTLKEYLIAKTKYSFAQGAFNGWIDRLLYDLRQAQELEASQDYQATLKEAVRNGDDFVQYVQQLFLGEQRGGGRIGTFVSVFLKPLTDAGITIWREVKDYLVTRHEKKEQVLQQVQLQLGPLKWKDFDEVFHSIDEPH